jgi:hypothetical protein
MWPIQLAFGFLISYSSAHWLSNTSSFLTWSVQLIFILLQHHSYILYTPNIYMCI